MSNFDRRRIPRVALLAETTRTDTLELLTGVRRYIAAHGPWSTYGHTPGQFRHSTPCVPVTAP